MQFNNSSNWLQQQLLEQFFFLFAWVSELLCFVWCVLGVGVLYDRVDVAIRLSGHLNFGETLFSI